MTKCKMRLDNMALLKAISCVSRTRVMSEASDSALKESNTKNDKMRHRRYTANSQVHIHVPGCDAMTHLDVR